MDQKGGQHARQLKNNIVTAYGTNGLAMATFVGNASVAAELVNNCVFRRRNEKAAAGCSSAADLSIPYRVDEHA